MTTKTLLQIVQTVVAELSKIAQPSAVLSSIDNNILKILALTTAVLDELTNEADWQFLQKRYTFQTVVNQETYDFPSDYARMIDGTMFDASNRWPINPTTPRQWEIVNIWNTTATPFERLRVFNNTLNFFPIPGAIYNFVFDYISTNCILNGATSEPQSTFTTDSDVILFDSRLVINFIKYKYIASVGGDTTTSLTDYQRRLETCRGMDGPAPRLSLLPRAPYLLSNRNIPDGNYGGV